ncbi:O-succinylhomoserine sulfhydrylase [Pseudomonas sp. F1_0610]|uniref:O-succinylhomoserine sulfhydrylase n=1 Tax=Pseudomonas sp. F1_0610 TaxID=3114284 RepID=UPI0039C0D373
MSIEWDAGRLNSDLSDVAQDTFAVRGGQHRTPEAEHGEPMFMTSSYVFQSAEQAAASFSGELGDVNVYSRYTNPTVRVFEERLAALEQGEQAVATASGMSAIYAVVMSLCSLGDHILVSRSVFGATISLFDKYCKRFGLEVDYVELDDLNAWKAACKPNTKLFFLESPSNPLAVVADIRAISQIAHAAGALLMVDNCFCTPIVQKPLTLGADIVIHSATKFIDGQGRCLGGAAVGRAEHMKELTGFLRTIGPTMSPFNAWVFLKGLETLHVRMKAHCQSALELAQWLSQQDKIEKVYYTGLTDHPQHELAKSQQTLFGAVLSFEVKGGREAAWRFINATRILSITSNLGDTKTTITHPATTTHGRLSDEDKRQAGIGENLIRISVGLEDINDLKNDFERGLSSI